jgi:hypothetical protein
MRWKSFLVDEFGGYDLGKILWDIQPINSSLSRRKNTTFRVVYSSGGWMKFIPLLGLHRMKTIL